MTFVKFSMEAFEKRTPYLNTLQDLINILHVLKKNRKTGTNLAIFLKDFNTTLFRSLMMNMAGRINVNTIIADNLHIIT